MAVHAKFDKDPDAVLDFSLQWGAGDWAGSTAYEKGVTVRNPADGCYYTSKVAHTSTTTLEADKAKWTVLSGGMWLDDAGGEDLASATWSITSENTEAPLLVIDSESNDAKGATVWLSGGGGASKYLVTCHITTTNSPAREDDRTIQVTVKNR